MRIIIPVRTIHFITSLAILLIFILGSTACESSGIKPTNTYSQQKIISTATYSQTNSPLPTPTKPSLKVLFIASEANNEPEIISLQNILEELVNKEGYHFETRNDLNNIVLDDSIHLVVVAPPGIGLLNLVASNSDIQFLAIGIEGAQASQNISTISSSGSISDQQGFLAGYLAAVITPDWRVGVITPAGSISGASSRNGFGNGVKFYCGLCRPAYPPYYEYPVFAELTDASSETEQQAVVDIMINNAVKTVFIYPGLEKEALLRSFGEAGINIIGGMTPPEQFRDNWIATIRIDMLEAVKEVWAKLLNGEKGIALEPPLLITDQNPGLLSPGRLQMVEKILDELEAGFIDTGVDLTTGELR